jgi:hypothetical protein
VGQVAYPVPAAFGQRQAGQKRPDNRGHADVNRGQREREQQNYCALNSGVIASPYHAAAFTTL